MTLTSFDIFDTALIRRCGRPEMIFHLLATRLFPSDKARRDAFLLWRMQAGVEAQRRVGKSREAAMADIYASPRLSVFADAYSAEQLMAQEMQLESEQLTANPRVRDLISEAREAGDTLCFISDMYLPSAFLEQMLRREGCLMGEEQVCVSCEEGGRKSDGRLFDALKRRLHPGRWRHYGDHPVSDVRRPRRRGIRAARIESGFTEIEQRILAAAPQSEAPEALSWLAGVQRAARLQQGDSPVAEMAADFIAPAYIPYVRFVMDEAVKRGIRRLYFLSRDSYILLEIAREMQSQYPDLELRYLFVSRKALLLPYLNLQLTAEQYLSVQDHETVLRRSVDALLSPLGTSRQELADRCQIHFDYERLWGRKEESDFLQKLFSPDSPYRTLLEARAAEKGELLRAYFQQEGLCDGVRSAMVDVGWLGTSRRMVNRLLRSYGVPSVEFFYYGVRGDVLPLSDGAYLSYFAPWQLSTELTSLVENYYSASPYPSTDGYVRGADGRMEPHFVGDEMRRDTDLTRIHISVVRQITHDLMTSGIDVTPVLRTWMMIPVDGVTNLSVRVPLEALLEAKDFDSTSFVRRLSPGEIFRRCCLGENITAFDKGSLYLSISSRLFPLLLRLSAFSGRVRRILFLKFIGAEISRPKYCK